MDIKFLQKSVIFRNMNDDEIGSALSVLHAAEKKYKKELGRMRNDGVISFRKNHFKNMG